MLMLMPDARFDGAAEYEQAVVGDRAEVRVYQANTLNDIPNDVWEATDGLMVWGRTPCNKDMLDRAENAHCHSYGRWLRRYRYRGSGQARHRCLQRAGLRHDGRCRSCDWFDVVADTWHRAPSHGTGRRAGGKMASHRHADRAAGAGCDFWHCRSRADRNGRRSSGQGPRHECDVLRSL